jgi:hypothetical protein
MLPEVSWDIYAFPLLVRGRKKQPARRRAGCVVPTAAPVALGLVILTCAPARLVKFIHRTAPFFGLLAPAFFGCLGLAGLFAERLEARIFLLVARLRVVVLPLVAHG